MEYFNSEKIIAKNEYVIWLDCMGSRMNMSKSLQISANFIFKFHNKIAKLSVGRESLKIYPVMDGVYISSEDGKEMLKFLASLFKAFCSDFIEEKNIWHCFIVRGAMSYGPVVHGSDISLDAFCKQNTNESTKKNICKHKSSILLGLPMVQAYESEKLAPPFGIALHDSVRAFASMKEKEFHHFWWKWFGSHYLYSKFKDKERLEKKVKEYFDYYEDHSLETGYTKEKIERHREMFDQYITYLSDQG